MLRKEFPGGVLVLSGGNAAAALRSMAVRYLFLDEIDTYPANLGNEGSAIALAEARTSTFENKKKIYKISTPTLDGKSNIQAEYLRSSMEKYFVPCPFCEHMQTLEWGQLRYDVERIPETVHYECIECRGKILEHHKTRMFERGQWIAERPEEKIVRGFLISSMYSPVGWLSWANMAKQYELARSDQNRLRTFFNTRLGLPFRDSGESPDFQRLYERREDYIPRMLPVGASVITGGIDVQRDRLEVMLTAWGRNGQKWLMDYQIINGDIDQDHVWDELESYLNTEWPVYGSDMKVLTTAFAIDAGFANLRVTKFAKRFSRRRCFLVKGTNTGQAAAFVSKPRDLEVKVNGQKVKSGMRVWNIYPDEAKSELFRHLLLPMPEDGKEFPRGFFHFHTDLKLEFFRGLCSEELVTKLVRGFQQTHFEKVYRRNEPLDTFIYSKAALHIIGGDRWNEQRWSMIEEDLGRDVAMIEAMDEAIIEDLESVAEKPAPAPMVDTKVQTALPKRPPPVIQRRKSKYLA